MEVSKRDYTIIEDKANGTKQGKTQKQVEFKGDRDNKIKNAVSTGVLKKKIAKKILISNTDSSIVKRKKNSGFSGKKNQDEKSLKCLSSFRKIKPKIDLKENPKVVLEKIDANKMLKKDVNEKVEKSEMIKKAEKLPTRRSSRTTNKRFCIIEDTSSEKDETYNDSPKRCKRKNISNKR